MEKLIKPQMRELAPLNFNVTVLCLQVSRQGKYYVRFISSIRSHDLEGTNNIEIWG